MTKASISLIALCSILLSSFAVPSLAQDSIEIKRIPASDQRFFEKQRKSINDLAKQHLGTQLRNNKANDLALLQSLLDKKIITQKDPLLLQAMGVVLGDLYIRELGVHWVVYKDKQGRSRALQWGQSKHVLFPITMISRRVKADVKVNVKALYSKGANVLMRVIKDENRRKMMSIN